MIVSAADDLMKPATSGPGTAGGAAKVVPSTLTVGAVPTRA